ncbi:MAG: hypothetical protein KAU38_17575 [Desulfobacterales bacterium]|nr:hypothetical protein [Desulfobacterales bacterium]
MIRFLYRSTQFDRCLNALRRAGGTAGIAARKADGIIDKLVFEGRNNSNEIGKVTRHGEFRIKKCMKYDLGGGYRLVCAKQGYHLILLYVGTHDDCDRWLNNNKGLHPIIDKESQEISSVQEIAPEVPLPQEEPQPEIDYDELLLEEIDDKSLRWVFRGLCGEKF